MALPQPPIKNMTEFVVFTFVSIVAVMLLFTTIGVAIVSTLNPDRDYSSITSSLTDILTTIIGALIGYIAGKGSGRAEVHDEAREREEAASTTPITTKKKVTTDADVT